MPETVPDESIRAQKIITFIKDKEVVAYASAYNPQQAWDHYLDCYKRYGPGSGAQVQDTVEVSRELSKKAWEELQKFKAKPKAKPKGKKETK